MSEPCYYCSGPYWRHIWVEGYSTPCCCMHARRIQRTGSPELRPRKRKVAPETARRLHRRGLSLSQIADAFGCGKTTVWESLQG